jgi:hypothetical protein
MVQTDLAQGGLLMNKCLRHVELLVIPASSSITAELVKLESSL